MTDAAFTDLLETIIDNRGRTAPTADSGIPLIATNCVQEDRLYPAKEKVRYVDDETYSNWFRGHPLPGDILFVCKGSPGRTALVPDPVDFVIAQDMVAVRADPSKIYPRFLLAALRSPVVRAQIDNMHVGSLIPHFKKGDFDKLRIPVLDRSAQVGIGDLYFMLSEKIESRRRSSSLTQELLRSLFRSWFVEFAPWDGDMPTDWHMGVLGDVLQSIRHPTKAGLLPDRPYVPVDMLPMRSLGLEGFRANEEAKSSLITFDKNDILLGAMRVYFHRVVVAPFDGITRSTTFVLRPRDSAYLEYSLLLCDQDSTIDYAASTSKGSTMPYAVWENGLADLTVPIPSTECARAFSETARPLVESIRDCLFETRRLAELRDVLLPGLLSGRISLPEAREATEAMA